MKTTATLAEKSGKRRGLSVLGKAKPLSKKKGVVLKSAPTCHSSKACSEPGEHPDHSAHLVRLRRVQGQIKGIENMIAERRYCVDILIQFSAVTSALKAIEAGVVERHVRSCVQGAINAKDPAEVDSKINELMTLFLKR